MSADFITSLATRTLGLTPVMQPLISSMFASGQIMTSDYLLGSEMEPDSPELAENLDEIQVAPLVPQDNLPIAKLRLSENQTSSPPQGNIESNTDGVVNEVGEPVQQDDKTQPLQPSRPNLPADLEPIGKMGKRDYQPQMNTTDRRYLVKDKEFSDRLLQQSTPEDQDTSTATPATPVPESQVKSGQYAESDIAFAVEDIPLQGVSEQDVKSAPTPTSPVVHSETIPLEQIPRRVEPLVNQVVQPVQQQEDNQIFASGLSLQAFAETSVIPSSQQAVELGKQQQEHQTFAPSLSELPASTEKSGLTHLSDRLTEKHPLGETLPAAEFPVSPPPESPQQPAAPGIIQPLVDADMPPPPQHPMSESQVRRHPYAELDALQQVEPIPSQAVSEQDKKNAATPTKAVQQFASHSLSRVEPLVNQVIEPFRQGEDNQAFATSQRSRIPVLVKSFVDKKDSSQGRRGDRQSGAGVLEHQNSKEDEIIPQSVSKVKLVPVFTQQPATPAVIEPQVNNQLQSRREKQAERREAAPTLPVSTPTIQITIGRIEVRGINPPSSPAPRNKPSQKSPALSLNDYLKQRHGGNQ